MSNLSVRGVDDTAVSKLEDEAKFRGISLNAYLVELLQRNAGVAARGARHPLHRDVDDLAGTGTPEDARVVDESQRDFETVDEDLWRGFAFSSIRTAYGLLTGQVAADFFPGCLCPQPHQGLTAEKPSL